MTNPTLERAARALAKMDGWDWDAMGKASNPILPEFRDDYLLQARAVLMAVRDDPGEDAAKEGGRMRYHGAANYGADEIFAAMIDAILNDGEGE